MSELQAIGVIFDMDGVLVDSAEAHLASWRMLAEECGGNVTDEQFSRTFGMQNRDIVPILFGAVSDSRRAALADRKEACYRKLIGDGAPVMPGAVELVRSLHELGVRLAVGSSGPRQNIDLVLDAMGASEWMTAIVSGDDVTRGKPDPQVFALCAHRLNLDPKWCVVVEDAPVGVEAALAAGARAVAVLTYHPHEAFRDHEPHLVAPHVEALSATELVALARRTG